MNVWLELFNNSFVSYSTIFVDFCRPFSSESLSIFENYLLRDYLSSCENEEIKEERKLVVVSNDPNCNLQSIYYYRTLIFF